MKLVLISGIYLGELSAILATRLNESLRVLSAVSQAQNSTASCVSHLENWFIFPWKARKDGDGCAGHTEWTWCVEGNAFKIKCWARNEKKIEWKSGWGVSRWDLRSVNLGSAMDGGKTAPNTSSLQSWKHWPMQLKTEELSLIPGSSRSAGGCIPINTQRGTAFLCAWKMIMEIFLLWGSLNAIL